MKKKLKNLILLGIFLPFILTGCSEEKQSTYTRDIFAMDTYINCQILAGNQDIAEEGLDRVEEAFLEIDNLTNRFDPNSELSLVNKNAGLAAVKVSPDLLAMVETALEWSDRTEGAFNILIGSAMNLWGFGSETPRVPTEEQIAEALLTMDYHEIILDTEKASLFLPEKGMVMDLGGVAKGYATDKAVTALKELGIENAIINAGGNVYTLGTRGDGNCWRIGVQDPRDPEAIVAVLEVSDFALVSSGDYQRYFEIEGIRYHHILDPFTAYPSRASAGTTVVMESAAVADILSTALFIKGPGEGITLAESLVEVEAAMIISGDGTIHGTGSMSKYVIEP